MPVWAPCLLGQVTIQEEGDRKGPDTFANITHVCVLHKLPHSFFTFQSRSYYPRFENEEIWGSKRLNNFPRVDGGVWFQIWDFLAPKPVPVQFWNLCSGEGDVRLKQQYSHLRGYISKLSFLFCCGGDQGRGWGQGYGGPRWGSGVWEDGESHVWPLSLCVAFTL